MTQTPIKQALFKQRGPIAFLIVILLGSAYIYSGDNASAFWAWRNQKVLPHFHKAKMITREDFGRKISETISFDAHSLRSATPSKLHINTQ